MKHNKPPALFEISWEVANMVGGIHTVLATKVAEMHRRYGADFVTIGPDIANLGEGPEQFREEMWMPELHQCLDDIDVEVRMGRWNVPGQPKALLVSYGNLHASKDKVLARYWETYRLDSLFGAWDYYDPVLFAHGAALVIERYYLNFLLPERREALVHAHEWMAAGAILHLREAVPEIGTVFTTHATTLGRALSANRRDPEMYAKLSSADPERLARDLGVSSKHSMEAVATRAADAFTTVSSITSLECEHLLGRKPDLILPNALSDEFPPGELGAPSVATRARERLFEIAELTTGDSYDRENTVLFVSAGRYEYENKGVDVYLDAVARFREDQAGGARVIAFCLYPAGHSGPVRELREAQERGEKAAGGPRHCTHDLRDERHDPITNQVGRLQIHNTPGDQVHVVQVPIYLDGADALIPERYWELLPGADLGIFASLYEPWGYTPMECIAFGVPTVTTDLAGFGRWAAERGDGDETGVAVLPREGRARELVVGDLYVELRRFLNMSREQRDAFRDAGLRTAQATRWGEFARHYFEAHELAAQKALARGREMPATRFMQLARRSVVTRGPEGVMAHLRHFSVRNELPTALVGLRTLADNLWWGWQPNAAKLFAEIDPHLWRDCEHNPHALLEQVPASRLRELADSAPFCESLARLNRDLRELVDATPEPEVAYFCMEYGLNAFLKIYSGGLGILAGDHLKTASDLGIHLCAVGLAYRHGYFKQRLGHQGQQEAHDDVNDYTSPPFKPVLAEDGSPITVSVPFPAGPVYVRAYRLNVGRVPLYLLDTDFDANRPGERGITSKLYGGDMANRLRQELVLGIGGYRMLRALDIDPAVFHMNEGHSAFLILARMARLMADHKLKYHEAWELVRHTTVFTTHTPVPAGHDHFPEELIRPYLAPFEAVIHKDWAQIAQLGRAPSHKEHDFGTTQLAAHGSIRVNGVSRIHGRVTRRMLQDMYPAMHPEEIPITSITNGVHPPTWVAPSWQSLFTAQVGPEWREHLTNDVRWQRVRQLDASVVWATHRQLRKQLAEALAQHIQQTWPRRGEDPFVINRAQELLESDTLLIGFARRFAPYKRADLLFRDIDRLAELLNQDKGAVLVIAGKAHPADGRGQDLIRRIVQYGRDPRLAGRVIFVENYNIDVAKLLVAGCDVWLNTPTRPLEASGTSGMKAAMNGVLNLSVDDGWWPEGYNGENGWLIPTPNLGGDHTEATDAYDTTQLLGLLEGEVLPTYYERDASGVPLRWVEMMKESIATLVPRFSSHRMVGDYQTLFYGPALENSRELSQNQYQVLQQLDAKKKRIIERWDDIEFVEVDIQGLDGEDVFIGAEITVEVALRHEGIDSAELLVEVVLARSPQQQELQGLNTHEMAQCAGEGSSSRWHVKFPCEEIGPHALGVRVVPRPYHSDHPLEPQLDLVHWL